MLACDEERLHLNARGQRRPVPALKAGTNGNWSTIHRCEESCPEPLWASFMHVKEGGCTCAPAASGPNAGVKACRTVRSAGALTADSDPPRGRAGRALLPPLAPAQTRAC